MTKHPTKQDIGDLLAQVSDEAEAAELTSNSNAALPPHVKVSRPGYSRSKVLQVRLNPEEMAALEAIAESRELPVSTVAREQILRLIAASEAGADSPGTLSAMLDLIGQLDQLAEGVRLQLPSQVTK